MGTIKVRTSPTQPSPEGRALESQTSKAQTLSLGEDLGEANREKVSAIKKNSKEVSTTTSTKSEAKVLSFGEDLGEANRAKVLDSKKNSKDVSTTTLTKSEAQVLSFGEDLGEANHTKVSPTGGDLEGAEASFAAIFDMDGTLINNTPYHFKSWQALFKKYGKGELTKEKYYTDISGVPVLDTIRNIFGADHDEAGLKALLEEKEEFYREAYAPYVAPINGLENFLTQLKNAGVKMAMATSATIQDVDFILRHIPIRSDFDEIVNSTMVSKPKPNPDIFLKAAEKLNMDPARCIVFEDSLAGIKAGNAAGMKVVGITTGHPADKLKPTDLVIDDYSELTLQKLAALFEKHNNE